MTARRRLLESIRLGAGHMIMDLREITAADESLIGLIALAVRLTRRAGGSVCVVTEDQTVVRKLHTTGLDQIIPRYAALNDIPDASQ